MLAVLDRPHDVEFPQADGLKVAQSQDARVDDNDIEAIKLIHCLGEVEVWLALRNCAPRQMGSAFSGPRRRSDCAGIEHEGIYSSVARRAF
ncbi:MAG: hypothetical protein JWQ17_5680 [Tardiphaga sp.]|nr:hypothetical protein [Tardiphaga sp.]